MADVAVNPDVAAVAVAAPAVVVAAVAVYFILFVSRGIWTTKDL